MTFEYDAIGRRISKCHKGKITRWIWDGNNPLHEWVEIKPAPAARPLQSSIPVVQLDLRNQVLQPIAPQAPPEIFWGDVDTPITWIFDPETFAPMGRLQGGLFYPIVSDYIGVPIAMFDSNDQKIWSADISLWGELENLNGNRGTCPFRWPGQYEDEEIGLYYNRFRYYDPDTGGYISQDPIRLDGQNANFYAYVPDPYSWIDPLGLAKGKCEVIVRRCNADEAAQMVREGWYKNLAAEVRNGFP